MKFAIASALLMTAFTTSANADALHGLSGSWTGSGKVLVEPLGRIPVKCTMNVDQTGPQTAMTGTCRYGILKKSFGMKLAADGTAVRGEYDGARTGVANLQGNKSADRVVLDIGWAAPVNGDRTARLTVVRQGPNQFMQTVGDRVDGKDVTTSSFTFRRM
ncbi:hypothetical protein [Ahrensia sp. R2A130]|uniref:hypothetical protein n=1 Tax=Ahrensia sp. R2A130 TaxID=744979 RepID=UPI0001E0C360|nr:hypothetical protein [Ahrensia sp. R2A130]EFL88770.1 conserved hypothetical protein [Ahrensia sp. R2A130]